MTEAEKESLKAKLLSRCERDKETGCLIWIGAWGQEGDYGVMRVEGKHVRVHTLAARLWLDPCTRFASHKDGCPRVCVEPSHLLAFQTQADLGRFQRGKRPWGNGFENGRASLNAYALELIVDSLAEGVEGYEDMAIRVSEVAGCKVTAHMVCRIARGELWQKELSASQRSILTRARERRKPVRRRRDEVA